MGFEILWDGFEKVCEKTERGEEFTRQCIKYMEKRHEIELKYAEGLGKMNSNFGDREDGSTKDCWTSFGVETANLSKDREAFTADITTIIQGLKDQWVLDKKTRIDLVAKGKKLVKDLANSEDLCAKARAKYVSARKQQQKSDEGYKALKVKGVQKNIEKAEKTLKKDKEFANAADDEYRKTVIALAKHQDKYYTEDMPALLKEFEAFERARILNTKRYFNMFIQHQAKLGPSWSQTTDRFHKKVDAINPDVDLNSFVTQNKPENAQPPPRAQYMSWDGTLIEDLGPRKDNSIKTTSVVSQPQNITNNTPKHDEAKTNNVQQPIFQQPVAQVQQPVQALSQAAQTASKVLVALYSYDATEAGELTFGEGELITLLEENDSGWWRGRLANGSEGLFPSNFVEEQGKDPVVTGTGSNVINANYKALYDYDAEDNTEISIKENDMLFVESEKDGWYYGYRQSDPSQKGNFPSNFVEKS
jgi:hypothetical protein